MGRGELWDDGFFREIFGNSWLCLALGNGTQILDKSGNKEKKNYYLVLYLLYF